MEDGILAHDFYQRAARGSVECYLALLDKPKEEQDESGPDYSGMTAAQKKREKVGLVGLETKNQRGREHAHCRKLAAHLFGYYWVLLCRPRQGRRRRSWRPRPRRRSSARSRSSRTAHSTHQVRIALQR